MAAGDAQVLDESVRDMSRADLEVEVARLRSVAAQAVAAAEALPDGVAMFDADDRMVYFNARYPEHLASSLRETLAVGKRFSDWFAEALARGPIYHPDMGEDFAARRLALRAAATAETEHRIADGRWMRVRESRTPDGGRVLLSTDVTEARRRDELIRMLASAVEQVGDPVEITDRDHGFVYVNAAFERVTGWRRDEAIGRLPQDLLSSGAHPPEFFADILDCLGRCESWHGVIVNRRKDGSQIEQETTISPLRDATTGKIAHYVAVKRDVTEARAQERRLAESEARYRAVVEAQQEFIVRLDPQGRYTFANEACERHYGLTLEQMQAGGQVDPMLLHPEDMPIYRAHMARIRPESPTHAVEWRTLLPSGEVRWEGWTDTGIFDEEGRLVEIQCVGRDVTDRKRAEADLAEREAQFRAIAEAVPVGLIISEIETARPLYANPMARRNLGVGPDDDLGSLLSVWEDPGQRDAVLEAIDREGQVNGFEARLVMPDGRRMTGLVSAAPVTWRGRPALLAVTVDVTAQRRTEAALRDADARLRAFIDFAPVATHLRDAEGRYLMINREMEKVLGIPAERAIGRLPREIAPPERVHDSDISHRRVIETGEVRVTEERLDHLDGPYSWAMAIRFPIRDASGDVRAAGTCVVDISDRKEAEAKLRASEARLAAIIAANPVAMNIARLSDRKLLFANEPYLRMFKLEGVDLETFDRTTLYADAADRDRIFAEIAAGRPVDDYELTLRCADGVARPAAITARPIEFEGERAVVTSSLDLTRQRAAEAELARSREALHQSEKMTALGALLAGVAHELNNPLSVVVGYSSMLRDVAPDLETRTRVERIHSAAERCARIVRGFLAMARARPPDRGPVDVRCLVEGALDLAAYGLRSAGVAIELDLPADLPAILGDADQLHQVVVNLVVNAQHALAEAPAPRRLRARAWSEGDWISLEFADNGPGMSEDVAKRAFEPFFTTKPQGLGTGVGLSVCHGIVRAHGGRIDLETTPGAGARFVIRLPVAVGGAEPDPKANHAADGRGRVLVVDDEPDLAEMIAERLHRDGFETETARSAADALRQIAARPFVAVVSDLRMPDMDGADLLSKIVAMRADLRGRVVLITGDALGLGRSRIPEDTPVFEKPLDLEAFAGALRRMLGGTDV